MTGLVRILPRPRAPFLDGMARLVDVGSTLGAHKRLDSATAADLYALQTDSEALRGDWSKVRQDARIATEEFIAGATAMIPTPAE